MTITKPFRIRRILKWAGVGLCVVILLLWAFSALWLIRYTGDEARITLVWGTVSYNEISGSLVDQRLKQGVMGRQSGWLTRGASFKAGGRPSVRYLLGFRLPEVSESAVGKPGEFAIRVVFVPLWSLFLLAAIPTALLIWRDRRRIPPGHCQKCGYNLTGNVSGICPECGAKIAAWEMKRPAPDIQSRERG